MQIPLPLLWLMLLITGTIAGSIGVWFAIAVRWHNDGTAIPYEPRQRVPWNALGALPAVCFGLLAAISSVFGGLSSARFGIESTYWQTLASTVVLLAFVAAVTAVLASRATASDLGLPHSFRQFGQDVRLGACGYFAAIVPVMSVQFASLWVSQDKTKHPLIDSIIENPSPGVLIGAFIAAAITAPLMEECVYRLLFQGWLERVEDGAIGFRETERRSPAPIPTTSESSQTMAIELIPDHLVERLPVSPGRGLLRGISHGFIPIVASSLLFSLAHLGHGIAPVAIFVLALFLGYLYQRTHRIVPCIVLHMLFNTTQLIVLWLTLQLPQPLFGLDLD